MKEGWREEEKRGDEEERESVSLRFKAMYVYKSLHSVSFVV